MKQGMKYGMKNQFLLAGLFLSGIVFAGIALGAVWTPYPPAAMGAGKFLPPSAAHLFGTDQFGRDIFSRVLRGAGTTLSIALAVTAMGALGGVALGAVTGYFGGWADTALMRLGDALTAFPSLLLALTAVSLLGPGSKSSLILSLGLVFIPGFARVSRTAYAAAREANYVKSARLMGVGRGRILLIHILPNTAPALLPALTIGFNNAVLAEASMSYLGIGVSPPEASLGYLLSEAQGMFSLAPWYALGTGFLMVAMVFGVGLIGEGLGKGGAAEC